MRILYLSRLQNVGKMESIALYAARQWRAMLDIDPHLQVIWTVPRTTMEEELEPLREIVGDRVTFWGCTPKAGPRRIGSFTTEELHEAFGQLKTPFLYDLVVTNQPQTLPLYRTVMTHHMQQQRWAITTPFVAQQMWTATMRALAESPEFYAGEQDVMAECIGSFYADWNVWESQHLFSEHLKSLRELMKPAVTKRVEDRSSVIPMGIDLSEIPERSDPTGVVGWGARLSASKRPDDTFRVIQATRLPALLMSPDDIEGELLTWATCVQANHAEFMRRMPELSAFVCRSRTESYGIGWLEFLASGVLGVFGKEQWVTDLLPNYPFVVPSEDEESMAAMARHLATNAMPETRAQWAGFVREHHDHRVNAKETLALLRYVFDQALIDDRPLGRWAYGVLALEAVGELYEGNPVWEQAVWDRMTEKNPSRQFGRPGDPVTRMHLRRALQVNGWEDVGSGPDAWFRRVA